MTLLDEKLPIINRLSFFESFSDDEKRQIVSEDTHFRVYQPGELLIRAGSIDRSLFVLLSGTVTITDPSGQTVFAILKPGDIFGEMAFLTDTRRTANVAAREAAITLKLDPVLFDRLSPEIREKFKDKIIEKLVLRLDRANKELSRPNAGRGKSISEPGKVTSPVPSPSPISQAAPKYLYGRKLIRRIISRTSELPPMPDVMMKVQQKLRLPGTSPLHLTKIIETDPAIVAGLLKMANSAYYGFRGKVSTVRHASALFGTRRLAELVTAMSSSGMLGKGLSGYALKSGDMWRHSIAVAQTSSEIAAIIAPEVADNVHMAGLLHDVGKLLLDPYIQERKVLFDHYFDKHRQKSFQEAERDILGVDHAVIAAILCENWDLPKAISFSIRHHHKPLTAGEHKLTHIVHAADFAVIQAGHFGSGYTTRPVLDEASFAMIPLDLETLHTLAARACEYAGTLTGKLLAA